MSDTNEGGTRQPSEATDPPAPETLETQGIGAQPRSETWQAATTNETPPITDDLDSPPAAQGLGEFRRKRYSIEFDERTLIWAIVGVLSLLVIVEGVSILRLRSRVKDLEGAASTGTPANAVQSTGGSMSWGASGDTAWGTGTTDGEDAGGTDTPGTDSAGTGATGTGWGATTTTGGWGTAPPGEPGGTTEPGADASGGATGWGTATGAGGNPEGTVGAMGSGTLPAATAAAVQGSAVMKSLEEFIETNAIDAVVADSLRNVVGESLAILQDIDNKVAAGQNPADAAVMKTKEHDRVKAAVVTLLGPVTGTALWETLYP